MFGRYSVVKPEKFFVSALILQQSVFNQELHLPNSIYVKLRLRK